MSLQELEDHAHRLQRHDGRPEPGRRETTPPQPLPQAHRRLHELRQPAHRQRQHQPARHELSYFVCLGRHQKRTTYTQKAIRIETVELRVEDEYAAQPITAEEAVEMRRYLTDEFRLLISTQRSESEQLTRDKQRLEHEQLKLLRSHDADAIPLELLKEGANPELTRISNQLAAIERRLVRHEAQLETITANLDRALVNTTTCIPFLHTARHRAGVKEMQLAEGVVGRS